MVSFSLMQILENLLFATRWTIVLSAIAFVCGGLVALLLLVGKVAAIRGVDRIINAYIQVFQGTPLLTQLFLAYFGLAMLGIDTSAWFAATLALTLYTSAYLVDIWYGCVNAVHKGQWEAAKTLALSFYEQLRYVILPQALRMAIPPTVGFMVQVIKGTALVSIIGFVELTRTGGMIANATYQPLLVYACVGAIYFCVCFPISLSARFLERKFHVSR
jgi:polar amino acid transport system permease protein